MPLWATKESSQLLKVKFGVALSLPEATQTGTDVAQALLLPVRAVCGDTSYRIVLTVHWLILMLKNHAPGCIGSSCVWMGTALCSARASLQLSVREGIMLPWHWRISPLLGDKADAQCSQERRGTVHAPGYSMYPKTSSLHRFVAFQSLSSWCLVSFATLQGARVDTSNHGRSENIYMHTILSIRFWLCWIFCLHRLKKS